METAQVPLGELQRMQGRPFGLDESSRPIDHGSGKLVVAAVEYLRAYIAQRAGRELRDDLSAD
ncbi:MAG: hypothetical protein ACP5QO_05200 [Clostridia bacterium]